MARLNFFTIFRLELGIRYVDVKLYKKEKLKDVLIMGEKISKKPFVYKLIDENGTLRENSIILVNGKNVHHLQKLDTIINDTDELALFPPGGGG